MTTIQARELLLRGRIVARHERWLPDPRLVKTTKTTIQTRELLLRSRMVARHER